MRFFVFFLFAINLFASDVVTLFKQKKFANICKNRWKYIKQLRFKDENRLSLVAYSCLKVYKITFALDVAKNLTTTKIGRNNALYIESLFLTKNLIISYLNGDKFDIFSLNIPSLKGNLISEIFKYIQNKKPKIYKHSIVFSYDDYKYKIYPFDHSTSLIVEIYDNNKLLKKVKIW